MVNMKLKSLLEKVWSSRAVLSLLGKDPAREIEVLTARLMVIGVTLPSKYHWFVILVVVMWPKLIHMHMEY
ncbi:hypothetical protein Hanom_Chr16g01447511 [Helianthus anomalus]